MFCGFYIEIWCFIPDTVSSSEDPLIRDQSTSTGVSPLAQSVVLQGNLKHTYENNQLSLSFLSFLQSKISLFSDSWDLVFWMKLLTQHVLPARASCEAWHPLLQPPWSAQGGRWAGRTHRLRGQAETDSFKNVCRESCSWIWLMLCVKNPYHQQQREQEPQTSSCLYLHSLK